MIQSFIYFKFKALIYRKIFYTIILRKYISNYIHKAYKDVMFISCLLPMERRAKEGWNHMNEYIRWWVKIILCIPPLFLKFPLWIKGVQVSKEDTIYLIYALNGRYWVYSEQGKNATFIQSLNQKPYILFPRDIPLNFHISSVH